MITARTKAGMSQRALATAMGVAQPFVAAFESGAKGWPDDRVTQALACIRTFATQRKKDQARMKAIIDKFNREGWPDAI